MNMVFVSYSHEDENAVTRLRDELRESGLQVWDAGGRLAPGEDTLKIFENIGNSRYFVLILSEASGRSEWVRKETDCALNRQIKYGKPTLIPVQIDFADLPIDMSTAISNLRMVDLRSHNYSRGLEELRACLAGVEGIPKSRPVRFRAFIESLMILDNEVWMKVDTLSTLGVEVYRRNRAEEKDDEIREFWQAQRGDWRRELQGILNSAKLQPTEVSRIMAEWDALR